MVCGNVRNVANLQTTRQTWENTLRHTWRESPIPATLVEKLSGPEILYKTILQFSTDKVCVKILIYNIFAGADILFKCIHQENTITKSSISVILAKLIILN